MESELHVESTAGQGSRFWFNLMLPKIPDTISEPNRAFPDNSTGNCSPDTPEASLLLPSAEELQRLLEFAEIGDLTMLRRYIHTLAHNDQQLIPFTQKLSRLVDSFRFDDVQHFLQHYLGKKSS